MIIRGETKTSFQKSKMSQLGRSQLIKPAEKNEKQNKSTIKKKLPPDNTADKNDELLGEKHTRNPPGNNFIFKTLSNRCSDDRKASRKILKSCEEFDVIMQ